MDPTVKQPIFNYLLGYPHWLFNRGPGDPQARAPGTDLGRALGPGPEPRVPGPKHPTPMQPKGPNRP